MTDAALTPTELAHLLAPALSDTQKLTLSGQTILLLDFAPEQSGREPKTAPLTGQYTDHDQLARLAVAAARHWQAEAARLRTLVDQQDEDANNYLRGEG